MSFSPVRERMPIRPHDAESFNREVDAIHAGSGTPLVASLESAGIERPARRAIAQSGYGRYILIVVTDGKSSDGDPRLA